MGYWNKVMVGVVSLALVLSGCAMQIEAPQASMTDDTATYNDEQGLFAVDYPAGWYVESHGFTERFGMPFPNVALGSSKEVVDLSSAEEVLPQGEIGVGVMLMPRSMFAEMGLADDAPLEELAQFAAAALSEGDTSFINDIEVVTLDNGTDAALFTGDGPTESARVYVQELGDGVVLFAPSVVAPGYRDEMLESQLDRIIASFKLNGSLADVEAHVADQMTAVADSDGAGVATFIATEYAYQGPESIPAGFTEIVIENAGEQPHSLWLVRLEDGRGVEDVMALFAAMESDPTIPEWIVFHGGVSARPGESGSYWIDLPPGQYAMFSFDADEEGVPDFAKGMLASLTVADSGGDMAAASPPQHDATVQFVDFSFVISPEFGAGEQLIEVTNTGMEPHEMVILRLAPDITVEQALEMIMSEDSSQGPGEMPDGPPPVEQVGVVPPVSAGLKAFYQTDLDPGNYLLVCFVPSPANEGAPHVALGMVQGLIVD